MGAMTVPVIGVAAIGSYYGIKALIGKSTQEAGSAEVGRDLGINVKKDTIKSFIGQYIDPSQAYGIRKDLLSSPAFLTQVAGPAAAAQDGWSSSLPASKPSRRRGVHSTSVPPSRSDRPLGTGSNSTTPSRPRSLPRRNCARCFPIWETKLMAVSDATTETKTANQLLIESLTSLRDSIAGSITPLSTMYDIFLETGEITDEFAAKIKSLGGDVEEFANLSALIGQQNGLKVQLGFVNDLIGRMQALTPQATVIEEIFSGIWKNSTAATLTSMGLDPEKLRAFTSLTGMTQGWDQAVAQFQQTGKVPVGGTLYQGIQQYGGNAGQVALDRLNQGFNTITPTLLADTYTRMQDAYQKEITSALDYLGSVQRETVDQIEALDQSINNAKQAVVDVLNAILVQTRRHGDRHRRELRVADGHTEDASADSRHWRPSADNHSRPDLRLRRLRRPGRTGESTTSKAWIGRLRYCLNADSDLLLLR